MIYFGIDPGKCGGLATIEVYGDEVHEVCAFVYSDRKLIELSERLCNSTSACCLEQVHAFPSQSAQSVFNFGDSFGYIRGVLDSFSLPYQLISPQRWKKEFGLNSDKQNSISVCKRLFPRVSLLATDRCRKEHDGMAEALLMAEYARRKL